MEDEEQLNEIAQAIFTVNRHAKTAPQPKHLYFIKNEAINKLLKENKAKKIGMHFSNQPRFSQQHSTLLIQVADYYFHIPPTKEDFDHYEHLGSLDQSYRNPPSKMSLSQAKRVLYPYIEWEPEKVNNNQYLTNKPIQSNRYTSAYYTPSSLGKMEWPPTKRKH